MFKKFRKKNTKQNKTYTVDKKLASTQSSSGNDEISDELLFVILDDYMM